MISTSVDVVHSRVVGWEWYHGSDLYDVFITSSIVLILHGFHCPHSSGEMRGVT